MGVVYYANYFVWLEIARTEFFRSAGISYREVEERGLFMMVVSATCNYKSPARYDDIVVIETWIPELKNSSIKFAHNLYVSENLIATGESVHVFTRKTGKPVRIPQEIRSLQETFTI